MPNQNTAQQIATILLGTKAVTLSTNPPYTWTSGIKSPIYCDNRVLISFPKAYKKITDEFIKIIEDNNIEFDIVSGTATAAIPWAAFLAYALNKPMVYVRHKSKDYGAGKQIEGKMPQGAKVLIVEDLISTGGSAVRSVEICCTEAKANVTAVLAIFTYEFPKANEAFSSVNIPLHTLCNFSTLIETATKEQYLKPEEKELIL